MTKKDYILIANVLKYAPADISGRVSKEAAKAIAAHFAVALGQENPAFVPSKFFKACGVD